MQVQKDLRAYVKIEPLPDASIATVAGIDASFGRKMIYAAVTVLDYETLETKDQAKAQQPVSFPYVPGLLSFREAPALLSALARLKSLPDVLIVDGHGWAHPRRFGLACHLGVLLDLPTIGCAKSLLVGEVGQLGATAGSTAKIEADGEVIGLAVRTRENIKPVYVSIGHKIDLPSAARIVLSCGRGYRLPEPTRQAHNMTQRIKHE
jgi:deoxyribonuclease V